MSDEMEWIVGLCEVQLGLVLAVAGIMKLLTGGRDDAARGAIHTFLPVLPAREVVVVWSAVLVVEFTLAALLVVDAARPYALAGTVICMFVFTCVLLFLAVRRGFDNDCGCFGRNSSESKDPGVAFGVWRNLIVLAFAMMLLLFETNGVRGMALTDMTTRDVGVAVMVFGMVAVLHRVAWKKVAASRSRNGALDAARAGMPRRT